MTDEERQMVQSYHLAFSGEHGERVYTDLMKWSGYDSRIMPGDVAVMGFELGRRDMFLHILDKMNVDPDAKEEPQEQVTEEENG